MLDNPAQFFGISDEIVPVVEAGITLAAVVNGLTEPEVSDTLEVVIGVTTLAAVVRDGLEAVVSGGKLAVVTGTDGLALAAKTPKAGPACSWYMVYTGLLHGSLTQAWSLSVLKNLHLFCPG